jgi:uroporphyrin-III C-methyltransferase
MQALWPLPDDLRSRQRPGAGLATALAVCGRGFLRRLLQLVVDGAGPRAGGGIARGTEARRRPAERARGAAALVGAGPGDPELLTLKAKRLLEAADVVLYDRLVGPGILALARPGARRIDVGKRCGRHAMSQDAINRLLVAEVAAGHRVVRLKGGDPFVFGRGGEELAALRTAGAAVEIVPGITAALGAAAGLGIPLTHRGLARTLALATAHGAALDWPALARAETTLVLYMGARTLAASAASLIAAGRDPATPVAVVENATRADERRRFGTLADIAATVAAARFTGPAIVIVGDVVRLAPEGLGFELGEEAVVALPHRLGRGSERGAVGADLARQRDREVGEEPSRSAREEEHAVGELDRLPDVVGDEEHRRRA